MADLIVITMRTLLAPFLMIADSVLLPGRLLMLYFHIHEMPVVDIFFLLLMTAIYLFLAWLTVAENYNLGYVFFEYLIKERLILVTLLPPVLGKLYYFLYDNMLLPHGALLTVYHVPGLTTLFPLSALTTICVLELFMWLEHRGTRLNPVEVEAYEEWRRFSSEGLGVYTNVSPKLLYYLYIAHRRGASYLHAMVLLKDALAKVPWIGRRISDRLLSETQLFEKPARMMGEKPLIDFNGFLLHNWDCYRLLVWLGVRYYSVRYPGRMPEGHPEKMRKMLKMTPEEEKRLSEWFVKYVRRHYDKIFVEPLPELIEQYARAVVTSSSNEEIREKIKDNPLLLKAFEITVPWKNSDESFIDIYPVFISAMVILENLHPTLKAASPAPAPAPEPERETAREQEKRREERPRAPRIPESREAAGHVEQSVFGGAKRLPVE